MNIDIDTPEGMIVAKAWLLRLIDTVNEGAVWGIPRSGAAYRINKDKQSFTRLTPQGDPSTEQVLKAMGWAVLL